MIVLSARRFRSIVLDARDGEARVAKRFHHSNPLLALFDGARARRELAALRALEQAGLPVPHAVGVRRGDAGWELELAAVPGARTLRELFERDEPPPGGWARLVARLGRVLARLQRLGWEHGDLHAGNVLVDALGAPWLVDLASARRARPDAARALSEVVHCAALAREALPARLRARFLVAWLRELPAELAPLLSGVELARALERRARTRRLHQVRLGLGRWLRESSRVRRVERREGSVWLRRDLPDELLGGPTAVGPPREGRASWLVLRGAARELGARWLGAARLHEHGLPVARPLAFFPGRAGHEAWAAFEPCGAEAGARSSAELDALLAARGLALAPSAPGAVASGAGLVLLPPREATDLLELDEELDAPGSGALRL